MKSKSKWRKWTIPVMGSTPNIKNKNPNIPKTGKAYLITNARYCHSFCNGTSEGMDQYYDFEDAREWNVVQTWTLNLKDDTGVRLEGWTSARNSKNRYRKQLRNFSKVCAPKRYIQLLTRKSNLKTDSIKSICRPMAMAMSQNLKLGTREDGEIEAEEVVLNIQGIICNQDLPPIQKLFEV